MPRYDIVSDLVNLSPTECNPQRFGAQSRSPASSLDSNMLLKSQVFFYSTSVETKTTYDIHHIKPSKITRLKHLPQTTAPSFRASTSSLGLRQGTKPPAKRKGKGQVAFFCIFLSHYYILLYYIVVFCLWIIRIIRIESFQNDFGPWTSKC